MFELPRPEPFRTARPPLVVASAQIRFPLIARLQTLAGVAQFQDRVAEFLPYMEQVHQQQILLSAGPLGMPTSPTSEQIVAWKFTNDQGWILSLEPGRATLSVDTRYTTGQDFRVNWRRVLEALGTAPVAVPRCDWISVRYVNIIDFPPEASGPWLTWLQPQLTGLLGATMFLDQTMVRASVTQTHLINTLNQPDPLQGLFRYGFLPQGTQVAFEPLSPPLQMPGTGFLMDTDLFIEGHQPFQVDRLLEQHDFLHAQQETFFLWALTSEGREHFGVETNERSA